MSTLATLVVKLVGDVGNFSKSMDGARDKLDTFGSNARQWGVGLSATVTAPLLLAGGAAIKFGQDLDSAMANVQSLGVARERVDELKQSVQEMAIQTGQSTTDLAGGLYQVISAFGDTADTAKILELNALAAGAGLSSTREAIDLTSAVTKAYGDTTATAVEHAADLALKTVQLGQTTFPELAGSIGAVSPLAAALGVEMEEMFAAMATGAGVTGSTSEVATQLRGILQSLMAPTDSMAGLINKLGYESGAAMIQAMGLDGSLAAIIAEAEASGKPLQDYISSIEGQTLALSLGGPQADDYKNKLLEMAGAAGTTNDAFMAQTEGINATGFQMDQIRAKMEVLAQQVYEALVPALDAILTIVEPMVDWLRQAAEKFAELDPKTQTWALAALGLAAALGPILLAVGTLAPLLGALLSPIGLVALAIGALALAWATNFGGIRDKTTEVFDAVKEKIQTVIDFIQPHIETALNFIRGWWEEHGDSVITIVTFLWDTIQGVVETVVKFLREHIETFLAAIQRFWDGHGKTIMDIASNAWETIQGVIDSVSKIIGGVVDALAALIKGDWEGVDKAVRDIVQGLSDFINTIWDGIKTHVELTVKLIKDFVIEKWQVIKEKVLEKVELLKTKLAEKWAEIKTAAQNKVLEMRNEIVKRIEAMKKRVLEIIQNIIDDIKKFFTETDWGAVGQSIVDGIANALSKGASAIADAARRAAQAALDAAKKLLGIDSPSKVFADEVGKPIVQGIGIGIIDNLRLLIRLVQQAAGELKTEGVKEFAAAVKEIVDIVGPALDGLMKLNAWDMKTNGEMKGRMEAFSAMIGALVVHLRNSAKYFSSEGLQAVKEFAESAGAGAKILGDSIEGLIKLNAWDMKTNGQMKDKMTAFSAMIGALVTHLSNSAKQFSEEVLGRVKQFADTVATVMKTIEGMGALVDLTLPTMEVAVAKMNDFMALSLLLTGYLFAMGDAINADVRKTAATFAADIAAIVEHVRQTFRALEELADSDVPGGLKRTLDDLIATLQQSVSPAHYAGYDLGRSWLDGIISGIKSLLPDLEAVLAYVRGLFPSSPAKYGPWRRLPDGEAVGGEFAGGLASGLNNGMGTLTGALAGLRVPFPTQTNSLGAGNNTTVNIYNPVGEPSEMSMTRQLRNLAAIGVLTA